MWEFSLTEKYKTLFSSKKKSIESRYNPTSPKLIKTIVGMAFGSLRNLKKSSKSFSTKNSTKTKRLGGAYA